MKSFCMILSLYLVGENECCYFNVHETTNPTLGVGGAGVFCLGVSGLVEKNKKYLVTCEKDKHSCYGIENMKIWAQI